MVLPRFLGCYSQLWCSGLQEFRSEYLQIERKNQLHNKMDLVRRIEEEGSVGSRFRRFLGRSAVPFMWKLEE